MGDIIFLSFLLTDGFLIMVTIYFVQIGDELYPIWVVSQQLMNIGKRYYKIWYSSLILCSLPTKKGDLLSLDVDILQTTRILRVCRQSNLRKILTLTLNYHRILAKGNL